ncbi:MAG: hypothetical protein JNM99_19580 [Verrucomicrobiaceae bacterium]|nr:hypothetical protein [Verrucomicrobiaceae bacterium]
MNFTHLRSMTLLALAASAALVSPAANAATSANGDLFLGFRATGGTGATKTYMVNLGQASQFTNATGPLTLSLGTVGADLGTLFGSSSAVTPWYSRSDLFWGIAGTTGSFDPVGSDPAKTLYATRKQLTPGTQSVPWVRKSDTTQGTTTTKMVSMMTAFNGSPAATATNAVSQNTTDANSWASFQPGGTTANSGPAPGVSFAAFNPSVEGTFGAGTAGSILDLYRMAPGSGPTIDTAGDYIGRFILNDSAALTFIPVASFGASTVQLASATGTVGEADGSITITVNRTGDVSSACSVQLSTTDGTALSGTDFTGVTNQVVNFGINETSKTVVISVTNRSGFQGDRAFTVSLNTPTSATVGTTGSATVTIQEAIEPSTLQFSAATFNANQEATTVQVTISRTGGSSAVTVQLSTSDDTAVAPGDYTAITNQTVNIPANTNSVNVTVTLSAPTGNQANKKFTVTLSNPGANASVGAQASASVRILALDAVAPTVAITSPAASAVVPGTLGGSVTITGTSLDAKGIDKVQVAINGGAFADATLTPTTGGAAWSISVNPSGGLTSIQVRALDGRGNTSTVVTRSFTYKIMSGLTVNIAGPTGGSSGTITGKLTGSAPYEVGKSYTFTAVPANSTIAFDNWAATGLTAPATELAKITFVFTPALAANPVITATFVSNPYASAANVAGSYTGLVKASTGTTPSNSTHGLINVNVTVGTGAFTATVKIGGESLAKMTVAAAPIALTGVFDNAGVAKFGAARSTTIQIPRLNNTPYVLAMSLNTTTKQITGTLKATARTGFATQSEFIADRAAYSATAKVPGMLLNKLVGVVPTSGYYTAVMPARPVSTVALDPAVTFAANEVPKGSGYTTVAVTNIGGVTFASVLADGTVITSATALLSASNKAIFYSQLYSTRGSIGGEVTIAKPGAYVEVSASDMFWFRPYQAVHHYPYGWPEGILTDMVGAEYNVVTGQSVVPGLPAVNLTTGNANILFTDGLLTASVSKDFNISTTNVITKLGTPADPSYTVTLTAATGLLSGTFTHSDLTKPAFKGVIVQKGANAGGHGHFLSVAPAVITGAGESGKVALTHK